MALKSRLFAGDAKLEAAAVSNPAHIVPGASGEHVSKIQRALILVDDARMSPEDLRFGRYGGSTAQAVLAYKTKRLIINTSYQTHADNIVGVMTMASLDTEMVKHERHFVPSYGCGDPGRSVDVAATAPRTLEAGTARATLAFGISERVTGAATSPVFPCDLNVVMMWTTAGLSEPIGRKWRYFEKARDILRPFSININNAPAPGEVPSNLLVTPRDRYDIWSVRKAADKVMPGQPGILRIIGCPFETTDPPYYAQTESGTLDGVTFVDFILLNARLMRADQCTVVHEMLHAASRADGKPTTLIDRWNHDLKDPDSVYSEGSNRSVLKPEYAQALSESFFARKR